MQKTRSLGIAALVMLALIYGFTPVMARFFSSQMGVYEQWYLRFFCAALLMAIVFRRQIRFHKLFAHSYREQFVAIMRGVIGFGAGAILYAMSTRYTTIASVSAMQILPFTALFGVVLLREKLGLSRAFLISLAFVGAFFVAVQNSMSLRFGLGEILSLVSGALFSLSYVLRKKQTGEMNNYELSFVSIVVGMVINYVLALVVTGHWLPPHTGSASATMWVYLVLAGMLSVAMGLLSNYGFEHVHAVTASIVMDMELAFGVLFGYVLYHEVLTLRQAAGAFIILLASAAASYLEARKTTKEERVEGQIYEQTRNA